MHPDNATNTRALIIDLPTFSKHVTFKIVLHCYRTIGKITVGYILSYHRFMLATYQPMTFRSSAESTLLSYIDRRQHAKDTLSAKHPTARVPTRLFSDLISAHAFRQVARAHNYIPFSKRYTHCRAHTSQLPLQPRWLACRPQAAPNDLNTLCCLAVRSVFRSRAYCCSICSWRRWSWKEETTDHIQSLNGYNG